MKLSKILVLAAALASFAFAEINLNTATKKELMSLPGIGESKAEAIIEYRKHNKFERIEDIKKVKGIGNKRFEMLKDDLTISGENDTTNLKSVAEKQKAKAQRKADKEVKNTKEKVKKETVILNSDTAEKAKKSKAKADKSVKDVKDNAKKAKQVKESVKK